jgi:Flp pilus assembly protein TadG
MRWRNIDLEKKPRGVAAVEMALVLPVFLTVLLGTLEATRLGTATQQLTNAAREACRVAVLPGSTQNDVQQRVNAVLSGSGITPPSVTPTPVNWSIASQGTPISVTLQIPFDQVSWLNSPFTRNLFDITVTGSATMNSQRP